MKIVGLTGGIGTGKSTVAAIFRELGTPTLDADAVARQIVAPGTPGLADVVRRFGASVLTPEGALDREALGRMVFRDPNARLDLEAITHPRVYAAIGKWLAARAAAGVSVAVVEVPLLFETASAIAFSATVCVTASRATQVQRVRERSGYDEATVAGILAAQMDPAEQARRADYVVDNNGDLAATRRQVADILRDLNDAA